MRVSKLAAEIIVKEMLSYKVPSKQSTRSKDLKTEPNKIIQKLIFYQRTTNAIIFHQ